MTPLQELGYVLLGGGIFGLIIIIWLKLTEKEKNESRN